MCINEMLPLFLNQSHDFPHFSHTNGTIVARDDARDDGYQPITSHRKYDCSQIKFKQIYTNLQNYLNMV